MTTKNPSKTILHCTQTTAAALFILLGSLFIFTGCLQLYKTLGLTDQQAQDQVEKDQVGRQKIIEGIRLTTTELITTAIAGVGAIASGFLAKWLGTERKITAVLIKGIEAEENNSIKKSVNTKAVAAGIEPKLAARVRALT